MNAELFVANVLAHWVQSGLLVAASLIVLRLMAPARPAFRLTALQAMLAAVVVLPVVQPRAAPLAPPVVTVTTKFFTAVITQPSGPDQIPAAVSRADVIPIVAGAIIAGVVLRLCWLLFGMFRLWLFRRNAVENATPPAAPSLEAALGVSPRYIVQPGHRGPWAFGILRPTIALPSTFGNLAPAVQRSVLCHELLHIKRRDVIAALVEELAVAALWFHPWAWLLRARIRVAREQTVDARAVGMLGNRDDYVKCLVDMSGHDLSPHLSHAGAGMLRPRELRTRIDAILKEAHMSPRRAAVSACLLLSVMTGTGLLAAGMFPLRVGGEFENVVHAPGQHVELKPVFSRAQSPAPPSEVRRQIRMTPAEYPPDALAKGIRGTVMVDITINPAGDVTTASVVSGPPELRSAAFTAAMGLKYEAGPSTTAGRVGVQFQIDRTSWGVRIVELRSGAPAGTVGSQAIVALPPSASESSKTDWMGAVRVGGDIGPPKKIRNVDPEYPAVAQEARVQGVVILEARVDESGNVSDVRPVRSIPLLDQAAIDAVKQWKYQPAVLNGVPAPVVMTLTVNFTLRDLIDVRLTLPGGETAAISMLAGGMTVVSPHGNFRLRAIRDRNAKAAVISVYHEDGGTLLGDVYVEEGGPVVQLPTTPAVGLQLIAIR